MTGRSIGTLGLCLTGNGRASNQAVPYGEVVRRVVRKTLGIAVEDPDVPRPDHPDCWAATAGSKTNVARPDVARGTGRRLAAFRAGWKGVLSLRLVSVLPEVVTGYVRVGSGCLCQPDQRCDRQGDRSTFQCGQKQAECDRRPDTLDMVG